LGVTKNIITSFRNFLYYRELSKPNIFGQSFYDELCESFEPKIVDYGTNKEMDNKKWIKDSPNVYLTFFKAVNDCTYVIMYSHGIIGFGIYNSFQRDKDIDVTTLKSLKDINRYFLFRDRPVGSALSVFNSFIYIILELLNKFNPKQVYFGGLTDSLKKLYKAMLIDRTFNSVLDNNGYEYIGNSKHPKTMEDVYIIRKK